MAREALDLHVCLPMLKESNKSRFDSFRVRDSALIISHITFQDCPVQVFFVTTFLEIVCINGISRALASSLIQYPYPIIQAAEFRVGHNYVLMLQVKMKNTGFLFHLYIYFSFSNGGKMKNHSITVTNPKRSRQGLFIIIMFDLEFT